MEPWSQHLNARLPASPLRTIPKIRTYASVSAEDVETDRVNVLFGDQITIDGKVFSKNAFDHVFLPENPQEEVCCKFLPDMVTSVFNGQDAAFVAIGAKSPGKERRLYGEDSTRPGIVHSLVVGLMEAVEQTKSEEQRFQVRMSAVMISQRDAAIIDLLSPFNTDPRRRSVRIVDDPKSGVYIENESEIRVDSIEQALFYLNTVVDHRLIQDEQTHRTSHVLVSLSLYSYRMCEKQLQGGRRRLSFLDMGIGERNSQNGGLTMPSIGCALLAMLQRNKHIPSRDTNVGQLMRCALTSSRSNVFFFSFASRNDDNENVAQLAHKISRTRKTSTAGTSKKASINGVETCSKSSGERRREQQLESGSEVSGAETVIYLGSNPALPPTPRAVHRTSRSFQEPPPKAPLSSPGVSPNHSTSSIPPMLQGHTPFLSASLRLYDELCSPPSTSASSPQAFGGNSYEDRGDFGVTIAKHVVSTVPRSKSKFNLDDGKRKHIMQWMESSEAPPILFNALDIAVDDSRECGILSHPLEDIIEQEEESMKTSTTNSRKDHPLRILSKQDLDKIESSGQKESNGEGEDGLEMAMAASISSIKSHDILAKLEALRTATPSGPSASVSASTGHSEMDMYRRASHLEEYALQRVQEIENENRSSKKKKKFVLNCCQQSMVSSSSTVVDWSAIERKKEEKLEAIELEKRKDELRERREKLKMEELELRRERSLIDKELDGKKSLTTTLARQLHHFSLSPCRATSSSHRSRATSDSLPSTPTSGHRKLLPSSPSRTPWTAGPITSYSSSHQSLPRHTKLSSSYRKSSADVSTASQSRKSSKTRSDKKERRSSKEDAWIRSPYSQMTSPRTYGGPGTSSSGRGSDDATSISREETKRTKRQSYSASSGYESASGDYHTYTKPSIFEKRTNEEKLSFARQADHIRIRQRQLMKQLEEAKKLIGQDEDVGALSTGLKTNGVNRTALIDALLQENKILEKRLVACRNHTMLVTTFI
ncbi:unnamed protein product [Caenorhabditis auriculariae]|uniref:Kinesin motor domain-containing protein n=1 Tax=Caenorhabditis auriculariae TaxID=2777116 RepID=A0A8S1GVC8_9PELO|nr:unnamed protein product [Caenorhabditis auriculariae]